MSYALAVTRKEAVLRQLRTEIVNGKLMPGTVLKDAEVAARVGLSITPVREAIAQLAAEGLIDVAPNRTRHVTHVTKKNALELVDVMTVLTCAGRAVSSDLSPCATYWLPCKDWMMRRAPAHERPFPQLPQARA